MKSSNNCQTVRCCSGPWVPPIAGNTQLLVVRVCKQFLGDKEILAIDRPSHFPHLNPIEHLWDILYWCIQCRQVLPQTVQELRYPDLRGDQQGHHPPTHQRRAQTLSGVYTLLSHVVKFTQVGSFCDFSFLFLFRCDFWIQPSMGWSFLFSLTVVVSTKDF